MKWSILVSGWVHVALGWMLVAWSWVTPADPSQPSPHRIALVRIAPPSQDAVTRPDALDLSPDDLERPPIPNEHALARDVEAPEQLQDTLDVHETLPVPRTVDPPVPEPHEPDEPRDLRYVRADPDADVTPAHDADAISTRDHQAEQQVEARVTARDAGARQRNQTGETRRTADLAQHGQARSRMGGDARAAARAGTRVTLLHPTSGARSRRSARGTSGENGAVRDGGPSARAGAGSRRPDRYAASGGIGGRAGFQSGPDGTRIPNIDGRAHSNAARSPAAAGTPAPRTSDAPATAPASPSRGDGIAMADTPGLASDAGGEPELDIDAPGSPGHRASSGHGEADDDTADAPFDPVADLQAFMGWKRPEWPDHLAGASGASDGEGAAARSPQATEAEVVRDYVDVSTRTDPLGLYIQRIEQAVLERWLDGDLSYYDRARGIQGEVVVEYVVEANGQVSSVEIARHSGHAELDILALGAIPERFPKIPRTLGEERLYQQITLRYRNPLLALGGRR